LCKHVISVLTTLEDVELLPEKYFLNRWRKDLKRPYKLIKSSYDPLSSNPTAERYAELSKNMLKLAAIAAPNVDHCTEVQSYVDMLTKKLGGQSYEQNPPSQSLPSASVTGNRTIDCMGVEVCSPLVARTKGKRSSNRKVSEVEKAVVKKSKGGNKKESDINQAVVKKSKGGNKKQCDTNPKRQRKEKQVFIVFKVVVCVKVS